ncbi:MAG: hypothetical protein ACYCWW_12360 [Deltaproteobacteria bacterium]
MFAAVWGPTLGLAWPLFLAPPGLALLFLDGQAAAEPRKGLALAMKLLGLVVLGAASVGLVNIVSLAILNVVAATLPPNTRTVILVALLTVALPFLLELGARRWNGYRQLSFSIGYFIGALVMVGFDVFGNQL